eukprot:GFYU01003594.1.p1 GENE.GFYU01003594.1~~GFYU01003594.1.p1  ORF type:complete len:771 (-),score=253.40 GFYU01003594.1:21-2333(-)
MACTHAATAMVNVPNASSNVYKEECTYCFDSADAPTGLDVCLTCFNGGCTGDQMHNKMHCNKSGHSLALNIKRREVKNEGPPEKITRLAIGVEGGAINEKQYTFETEFKCVPCNAAVPEPSVQMTASKEGIMNALSISKRDELSSWENQLTSCTHIDNCQQTEASLAAKTLAHCQSCELNNNLWLCLVCGSLGCGRRQYDGSGGNGHALDHATSSGHGASVKLGTITPEGKADLYCYICDDDRTDPKLAEHLRHFGIDVAAQKKTEQSTQEMELEKNLTLDLTATIEDGKNMEPRFGPGLTGIRNLGNTCYIASTMQLLFNLPSFQERYVASAADHMQMCQDAPGSCFHCQIHKLAHGLMSGRYSQSVEGQEGQEGISPLMFKQVVGKNHPEFSNMEQQDAAEFFRHAVKMLQQRERAVYGEDPSKVMKYSSEQRLQCMKCQQVRLQSADEESLTARIPMDKSRSVEGEDYPHVEFMDCMDTVLGESTEIVEFSCPNCNEKTQAKKGALLASFPDTLVVVMTRLSFEGWVPKKLMVHVDVPETIDLEKFRARGLQSGESAMADGGGATAAPAGPPMPSDESIMMLESMGFPRNRCIRALMNCSNNAEVAMNWILEHMDDPGIDDPIEQPSAAPTAAPAAVAADPEAVANLCAMGFSEPQAKKALRETGGNMERAVDWLFSHPDDPGDVGGAPAAAAAPAAPTAPTVADDGRPPKYELAGFITHRGSSMECGHYVAHLKKGDEWVMFNDNKVVVVPNPPKSGGYMYFFRKW